MAALELTPDLFARLDRAEARMVQMKEEAFAGQATYVRSFGNAVACINKDSKSTLFNRAVGVGAEEADRIVAIVAWYAECDVPARIDVCPARQSPELSARLRECGLENCGLPFWSHRLMAGRPETVEERDSGTAVRPVDFAELELFATIGNRVWPTSLEHHLAYARATHDLPGLRRYFAWVDGEAVAIASLHIVERVGIFQIAGTLEEHRGKGCQTALLRRRAADAVEAGCDLVTSLVAPDSGSQRNIQRAGLEIACDREMWLPSDWMEHPFYKE